MKVKLITGTMNQYCPANLWDVQTPELQRLLMSFRVFRAIEEVSPQFCTKEIWENLNTENKQLLQYFNILEAEDGQVQNFVGLLPDETGKIEHGDLKELAIRYEKMAMQNLVHYDEFK